MNVAATIEQPLEQISTVVHLEQGVAYDQPPEQELSKENKTASQTRAIVEWDVRRGQAKRILQARIEAQTVAKVMDAAEKLAEALRRARAESESAYSMLRELDPSRDREWRNIARSHSHITRVIAKQLEGLLPIDSKVVVSRALWDLEVCEEDRKTFAHALDILDRLELVF